MALFKWLGDNISFVIRKWATYVFRRGDPLSWLIKWWSFSLAGELGQVIADKRLDEIFDKVRTYLGELWTGLLEVISNIILFNFDVGFNWLNISLKLLLIILGAILIAWRDKKRIVQIISPRVDFDVTESWFGIMYEKHFTREIKSKFESELYKDQNDLGSFLLEEIGGKSQNQILNEVRILRDWLTDFKQAHEEMAAFFEENKIKRNRDSNQFKQFEYLNANLDKYKATVDSLKETLVDKGYHELRETERLEWDSDIKISDYKSSYIETYSEEDEYLINPPGEEDWFPIELTFRRFKQIEHQIFVVNSMLDNYRSNVCVVYGDAGMGKSNLSAFLTSTLKNQEKPVIFIKAKFFSGDPNEFESIFLKNLDVPEGYTLTEVLGLINKFGKDQNCRVTIIIDGLNETSHEANGFSTIWQKHLDDFLSRIINYPNIFFLATLRRSYIDRIWSIGEIPAEYISREMTGFDGEVIVGVVKDYFNVYKITYDALTSEDIFYFRTPLLLSLYCQMLNPKKQNPVQATLGLNGFRDVFDKYIDNLAQEIKHDLSLQSKNQIHDGFSRCSVLMLDELDAYVLNEEFYKLFEEDKNKYILDTIGYKVLEGYLIYIEDSIKKRDVISHTQQEVGGYLLAKSLIDTYGDVEEIIASEFFQNHIVGAKKHLLADDILKFLTVDSTSNELILSRFGDQSVIRNFVLNKIQREKRDGHLVQLKDNLISKVKEEGDFYSILNISKTRFLDVNSALNILEVKNELLKEMSLREFEMTWTKFLYDDWAKMSDFIADCEKMVLAWKKSQELNEQDKLRFELLILTLESTIPEFRERVSNILVELGTKFTDLFFDKLIEYAGYNKLYIYERLSSISYGICLRKQNDEAFCQEKLSKLAERIYELQFSEACTNPSFHYVVIDSFKHIIDLAMLKKVYNLPEGVDLSRYSFELPGWTEISEAHRTQLNDCIYSAYTTNCPDPLRMDFVIYTIPRLVLDDENDKLNATANIFNRIKSNGYDPGYAETIERDSIKKFYFGSVPFAFEGKVERLGKKYSWNAFYEYAGYLLSKEQLPIWSEYDKTGSKPTYSRLGELYFEVSQPNYEEYTIDEPVFQGNLLDVRSDNPEWVNTEKFDVLNDVRIANFDGKEFTLLHGYFEYKPDANYDVRTLLFCESFLIKREDIEGREGEIHNLITPWKNELSTHGYLYNTYFGELYWADSIPDGKMDSLTIYLNEKEEYQKVLEMRDLIDGYPDKKQGDKITATRNKQIHMKGEPTVVEYLWESNPDVTNAKGYDDYIPYFSIGKHLNLKADSIKMQLLDDTGDVATKRVNYNNDEKELQRLTYLRSDLLKKYMEENDLVLLYQVKQFTHDRLVKGDGSQVDMRSIKYILPHLMD